MKRFERLPGRDIGPRFKSPLHRAAGSIGFKADIIDTWAMTITPIDEVYEVRKKPNTGLAADNYAFEDSAGKSVPLPGKPYIALRIRAVQ